MTNSNELSTGLVAAMPNQGPPELDPTKWYCPVNIDNTNGNFKLAVGTGTPPNECSSHGATINSYGAITASGSDRVRASDRWVQQDMPSGLTLATTWDMFGFFSWRLQDPNFQPNWTYVWWAANGVCAVVSAGFPAMAPYCAQARAWTDVNVPVSYGVSGSNSAFDWDETIIPPRAP